MEGMGEGMGDDFDDSDDEGITFLATSFTIMCLSSGKFVATCVTWTCINRFNSLMQSPFF